MSGHVLLRYLRKFQGELVDGLVIKLLVPFFETNADIVYGSRFLGGGKYVRIHFFWHFLANKILTFLCNLMTNLNLFFNIFFRGINLILKLRDFSLNIILRCTFCHPYFYIRRIVQHFWF